MKWGKGQNKWREVKKWLRKLKGWKVIEEKRSNLREIKYGKGENKGKVMCGKGMTMRQWQWWKGPNKEKKRGYRRKSRIEGKWSEVRSKWGGKQWRKVQKEKNELRKIIQMRVN